MKAPACGGTESMSIATIISTATMSGIKKILIEML
jgi:hypothetical protein